MSVSSPTVPRPTHVLEEAVYDFDIHLDPQLLSDPHERLREILRDAPAVFWTPRNGGHWVAFRYKEVSEASRNPETFSSELWPHSALTELMAALPPGAARIPRSTPIDMDPPDHARYRAPLQAAFSPKAMMARRDGIRELANSLIDAVIDQGYCDFIPAIGEPLPVRVFLKMMGLPLDRQAEFRNLVHAFLAPGMNDLAELGRRLRLIADAMKGAIEAKQREPGDDLISLLWRSEIDGKPMTYETLEDYGVLLFIAGLDTVINGMGFGIRHLARNPHLQDHLRANPKQIVEAAEELLRRYSFSTTGRRVTKDVQLGGWQMKEGDRLTIYLPAANLDPLEFSEPETFDLNRQNKAHVAFGMGPHRCLGSHLARIELQVLYEQMLARLPTFRLDPEQPVKFHAGSILAIDSLPLRWD